MASGMRSAGIGAAAPRLWPMLVALLPALLGCASTPREAGSSPPEAIVLRWNPERPLPPVMVDTPPASVTVRWNSARTQDAAGLAEQQCNAWNRHAVRVEERSDGAQHAAEFVCR